MNPKLRRCECSQAYEQNRQEKLKTVAHKLIDLGIQHGFSISVAIKNENVYVTDCDADQLSFVTTEYCFKITPDGLMVII